jgi:putative ABC transport system permease protein
MAYGMAQRTRELGVRIALGARRADVVRLALGEGARIAAAGILIGLLLAVPRAGRIDPALAFRSE